MVLWRRLWVDAHVRVVGLTHALRRARLHSVVAAAFVEVTSRVARIHLYLTLYCQRGESRHSGAHSPRANNESKATHGLPENVVQDYKDEWENQDRKFHLLLEMSPNCLNHLSSQRRVAE